MSKKNQLIQDIQNLLNSYDNVNSTSINQDVLQFMDENTLIDIIDSLLIQKEQSQKPDAIWLEKFKKYSV